MGRWFNMQILIVFGRDNYNREGIQGLKGNGLGSISLQFNVGEDGVICAGEERVFWKCFRGKILNFGAIFMKIFMSEIFIL